MDSTDSYSNTAAEPSTDATNDTGSDTDNEAAEDKDENLALLPKSLFGHDCKPGDRYTVEVTETFEDEIAVKHVRSGKSDKPNDVSMKA